MTKALLFWILMLIWFVFGLWWNWSAGYGFVGGQVLLFAVIALLGWRTFGAPIQG